MTSTTKLTTTAAVLATVLCLPAAALATDYKGAVLLRGEDDVTVDGIQALDGAQDAYYSWQGDTLFAGATDRATGNQVSMLAEFYWFESSLERRADFYTVLLKVKTSPKTDSAWQLDVDGGEHWYNPDRTFNPTQELVVEMNPSGAGGAIRWDWCAPFTDYKFEPMRTVNIEQGYSLGLDTEGSATAELRGDGTSARIVGKGSFDARRKVTSNYTMTLFAWQMFVTGGADRMGWKLGLTDGERSKQSAYHEYLLVVQTQRGRPAEITSIEFAGNLREDRYAGRDTKQTVAALLQGIRINPPSADVLADARRRAALGDDTGADVGTTTPTDTGFEPADQTADDVWLNEVFADSEGADAGTFIELEGEPGTDLDDYSLVGVSGSTGTSYETISLAGKRIGESGYFVIAQDASVANADVVAAGANLRNGPDNLLLVRGGRIVDALGYGAFEARHHFVGEGAPAVLERGKSLGRVARDSNDNAADWGALEHPTPGAANGAALVAPGAGPVAPAGTTSAGLECERTSDCAVGRICTARGTCVNECAADRDCGFGGSCLAGRCAAAPAADAVDAPAPECRADRDCDAHQLCNTAGACIAECRSDRDCPASMACGAGVCQAGVNTAQAEGTTLSSLPTSGGCSTAAGGSNLTAVVAAALMALGLLMLSARRPR